MIEYLHSFLKAASGITEDIMDMSIGSNSINSSMFGTINNDSKTNSLESTLKNSNASDKQLMDACKSFESYLLEQVYKSMESTVDKSEEENNDYLKQFGDMLYENYADLTAKNQSTGIAQTLYDSMKRNS